MATFGNFYKCVLSTKELRPNLQYAIVKEGFIMGSDGHVLFKVSLETWVGENAGVEFAEGKAFHYELLKKMAQTKYKKITFTETKVILHTSKDVEECFYSAELKENREYYTLNSEGKRIKVTADEEAFINIPDFDSVIPKEFGESFSRIGFDPTLLKNLTECFKSSNDNDIVIKMEFAENRGSENYPCKGMRIKPINTDGWNDYGIIMPVHLID
jgi:hypothetical protein